MRSTGRREPAYYSVAVSYRAGSDRCSGELFLERLTSVTLTVYTVGMTKTQKAYELGLKRGRKSGALSVPHKYTAMEKAAFKAGVQEAWSAK